MIWHQYICSDPRTVCRTFFSKANKTFVDGLIGKNSATVSRAGSNKINGRSYVDPLKSIEPLLSIFRGHRPPLQLFAQPRQQLLVDIIKSPIAENRDDVIRP